MKRFFTICLLLLTRIAFAQTNYIGAEIAYSKDLFSINDPGGYMKQPTINSAMWGLNFRHMISKNFFVETGVYARAYKIGVAFTNETENITTDRHAVMIPARAGVRLPFLKERVSICPVAGIGLSLSTDGNVLKHENQLDYNGVNIHFVYEPQYKAQSYAMAQVGLGIDIRIGKRNLLTLNSNLYSGFTKIVIQHVTYSVNNGPEINATSSNRGSFYTLGIGYRFKI